MRSCEASTPSAAAADLSSLRRKPPWTPRKQKRKRGQVEVEVEVQAEAEEVEVEVEVEVTEVAAGVEEATRPGRRVSLAEVVASLLTRAVVAAGLSSGRARVAFA